LKLAHELDTLRKLNNSSSNNRYREVRAELERILNPNISEAKQFIIDTQVIIGAPQLTSYTKDLSSSLLSRKHPSTSTLAAGPRKSVSTKAPSKRPGENLESPRSQPPFKKLDVGISRDPNRSNFNGTFSAAPTNFSTQAHSSVIESRAETSVEEPTSDDLDRMEAEHEELTAKIAHFKKNARENAPHTKEAQAKEAREKKKAETEELARRTTMLKNNPHQYFRRLKKEKKSKVPSKAKDTEEGNTLTDEEIYQGDMSRSRQVRQNRLQAAEEDKARAGYEDEEYSEHEDDVQMQETLENEREQAQVNKAQEDKLQAQRKMTTKMAEKLAEKLTAKTLAGKPQAEKTQAAERTQVIDRAQTTEEALGDEEQSRSRWQNQAPSPSTSESAWMREAKADLREHYFQIFCIQAEIIARRTGR
jgi:hypothetical protein